MDAGIEGDDLEDLFKSVRTCAAPPRVCDARQGWRFVDQQTLLTFA